MKALFLVSFLVLLFGLISQRLHRTMMTPPIVFVSVGLIVGAGLLGSFGSYDGFELTRALAELTLILVLFTDASRIRFRDLRKDYARICEARKANAPEEWAPAHHISPRISFQVPAQR